MNEDTRNTAKIVLAEIAEAKTYSETPKMNDLFMSSETLVSCLASLIGPLMDCETAYRQKVKLYMQNKDENKQWSVAKAEAHAMAEDEYRDWKKLKMVYELADAQIMLIKKFGTLLGDEYRRTV